MKKLIIIILSVFLIPFQVNAESTGLLIQQDEVTSNETSIIDEDDRINGSHFSVGNDITINKNVNGIMFALGNNITLRQFNEYGIFAGNSLRIENTIEKDVFAAAESIILTKNGTIGRNAYLTANSIIIEGKINGNANIVANKFDLRNATIYGDIDIKASNVLLNANTLVSGTLKYNNDANISGLSNATIANTEIYENDINESESTITKINTLTSNYIFKVVSLFIVAFVITFFMPKVYQKITENLTINNLVKKSLKGLVILVFLPIISLIIMLTGFGFPLGFMIIVLYLIALYLSNIMTMIITGNLMLTKVLKKDDNKYLALLIGIALVSFVQMIPVIGPLVSLISIVLGLGIIYKLMPIKNK